MSFKVKYLSLSSQLRIPVMAIACCALLLTQPMTIDGFAMAISKKQGSVQESKVYVPQDSSPRILVDSPAAVVPLTSGVQAGGSISGASPGTCVLSGTQYSIDVPPNTTQLKIDLNGSQDVDLFARFGQQIAIQGGQVIADFASATLAPFESITITPATSPALQQGTYFIGIGNCSFLTASYVITATVTVLAVPVPLTSGVTISGNVPAANAGSCLLTAPQFTIQVPGGSTQLKVDLSGDQNVELFVRVGQPSVVQSNQVVSDYSSTGPSSTESVTVNSSSVPPLQEGTYFIAIGNCAQASANFSLTATVSTGPPPNLPNLIPFQPAGWSDKIVISTAPGNHSDSVIEASDSLFVDWAVRNSGIAATAARFTVKLLVDGTEKGSWSVDSPLNPNAVSTIEDFALPNPGVGNHSVKLVVDSQANISESNESDNEFTKNISVAAQACRSLSIEVTPNNGGTATANSPSNCLAPGAGVSPSSAAIRPGPTAASMYKSGATVRRFNSQLMSKAERAGSVRIVIGLSEKFRAEGSLDGPQSVEIQRIRIALAQDRLLSGMPGFEERSLKRFQTIPFLSLATNADGLRYLESSAEVSSIEEDEAVPASLAESVPLIGAPAAWASGFSGAGQAVVILDTGVDKNHPFLAGKVVSEACFSTTSSNSSSFCAGGFPQSTAPGSGLNCTVGGCEHGTHVAGIAAGKGTTFSGVAKDANIIAIQVFSRFNNQSDCDEDTAPCAKSFVSDQILGLERVQALAGSFQIAAVNMSLGSGKFNSNCDVAQAARKAAIDNLRSLGISTVISSGNSGFTDSLGAPACISSAISVGSTADGSEGTIIDRVSNFSNSASFLNLLAPGQVISSSVPGGGFASLQGTSMSAPHVTGAIAVLKSKVPTASVDQILAALTSSGVPIPDSRNSLVKPRIQLDAALNALNPASGAGRYNSGTMVTLTATANPGFAFVKWLRDGADFSTNAVVSVTMDTSHTLTAVFSSGPIINSVTLQGAKTVKIDGVNLGQNPQVVINDVDRSDFLRSNSSTSITLKGKQKKLGLKTGENRIQVIGDGGAVSNTFVLNL